MAASYDFPQGLTDAQDELRQLRAELHTLYQRVPWSQDAAEITRLRARELTLATAIVTHAYWSEFTAADILAARTALKHHHKPEMADASS
ncbi:hypothetical protein [Streptomyces sp. NBC_01538]|uniref:hypothetical protein n=1 Tax=Streptomyces sp. NBC_01538 TaxID=2903897 RepID=UPI0038654481